MARPVGGRPDADHGADLSWWTEAARGVLALLAAVGMVLALVGGALVLSRLALRVIE